jgi:selenocysteine lyase/cysteine desulfurase
LVESVESVLLSLLTQIPSPDLYNLAPPSSPSATSHTPHSTAQDHTASYRTAKATMDAIENCREEVPGNLEANQLVLGDSVRESLAKVMATCSQLASSDSYLEHKKDKVRTSKVYMYVSYRTQLASKINVTLSFIS